MSLNQFQRQALVERTTNQRLHLKPLESVTKVAHPSPDVLAAAVERVECTFRKSGDVHISKRGVTLYQFQLDQNTGQWQLVNEVTVWRKVSEVLTSRQPRQY